MQSKFDRARVRSSVALTTGTMRPLFRHTDSRAQVVPNYVVCALYSRVDSILRPFWTLETLLQASYRVPAGRL